ncbi:hypothetical protein ACGFNU_34290 [Spirillospora sp. NPDC048911]|uniref:hypothetical protein n=1 Tax=Spirillospora sp. NPDC048911 TaxID=3364527 RepID=UPI003720B371
MSRINPAAAIAAVAAALAVGTVHTPASSAAGMDARPPSVKVTRATVIGKTTVKVQGTYVCRQSTRLVAVVGQPPGKGMVVQRAGAGDIGNLSCDGRSHRFTIRAGRQRPFSGSWKRTSASVAALLMFAKNNTWYSEARYQRVQRLR